MPDSTLDERLDSFSLELEGWLVRFFDHHHPADGFARLLGYPLGWVDADLRPLDPPAPAGKRLRPALCLLTCEAVGGDHRPALAAAAAVELVHNFSLVHDDIQDESPLRRGRPTVWAGWGGAQAINVGDGLFALAQLALIHGASDTGGPYVDAVRRLNQTCLRLVEGQYLDLHLQSTGAATFEAYQAMISGKTAALLECAAWLGARFAGADSERAEQFARFGRETGVAFQYQDDLLGVWGNPALTGKSADTDLRTRKQALPAILGLQSDHPAAVDFKRLFLSSVPMTAEQATEAAAILERIGARAEAERTVEEGYARAERALREALGSSVDSPLVDLLERFRTREA